MPTLTSSPSSQQAITLNLTSWFLKDPTDDAANIKLFINAESFETTAREAQTVHYPLGRTRPVVEAESLYGEEGSVELSFLSDADFNAFETLRTRQRTLLLQSPYGHNLYLRLGAERRQSHFISVGPEDRAVGIGFVEVDPPA